MGFMDKVKSQATQLAEKAQEGLQSGKDKLDVMQERKRAQGLLQELGALVYRRHTGRTTEDAEADIERLVGELQKVEAEGVDFLRDADTAASDATNATEKPAEDAPGA